MPRPALVINAAEYLIAVVTHLPTAGGAAAPLGQARPGPRTGHVSSVAVPVVSPFRRAAQPRAEPSVPASAFPAGIDRANSTLVEFITC